MVAFNDLWRGHPINHSVQNPCLAPRDLTNLEGNAISAGRKTFGNQCAIRMGVALRQAGVPAAKLSGCTHCQVHSRDEMHFINAQQLAHAIGRANLEGFGPLERFGGADAAQFYPKMFGRTGVMFIADYWKRTGEAKATGDHIDVWNGYRSSAKWLMEWFSWLGYYSNYAEASEIWFWEVK